MQDQKALNIVTKSDTLRPKTVSKTKAGNNESLEITRNNRSVTMLLFSRNKSVGHFTTMASISWLYGQRDP